MTDIPRGQGGDGSPQLDDGEIDARLRAVGLHDAADARASFVEAGQRLSASLAGRGSPQLDLDAIEELDELEQTRVQLAGCGVAALGYDLDLPKDAYGWSPSFEQVADLYREKVALRGRVEELTEALRKYSVHKTGCTMNSLQRATGECICGLGALLARVDPEKETPGAALTERGIREMQARGE